MPVVPTVLVTGKYGQVGDALSPALKGLGRIVAVGRGECDITDDDAIVRLIRKTRPNIIVNAAAYTAVDKAETDPDRAFAVNARAPGVLGEVARESGAALIHYSTDYVFDGAKQEPYREDDPTNPLGVYGASKREGEIALRQSGARSLILRTSWVFSTHGANFLKTMLQLGRERDQLSVVADQVGAPTSASMIADFTARIVQSILKDPEGAEYGTYHLCAAGETSWHGYAVYLLEQARQLGMPVRFKPEMIKPIPASAYPTPAIRPANSRLDTGKLREMFDLQPPPWQDGVRTAVETLAKAGTRKAP